MALVKPPYGKDRVAKGSEGYISEALRGGSGPSEGIHDKKIDRKDQSIMTAVAMDNVDLCMDIETSILEEGGFRGSPTNLDHSLTGTSAVNEKVGADGPVHETIIPNH